MFFINNEKTDFFYEQMYDRLANCMKNYYNGVNDDQKQLTVPLELQISFIDSALLGLICHWLKDGMIYTARYMTRSVEKMLDQFSGKHMTIADSFIGEKNSALENI